MNKYFQNIAVQEMTPGESARSRTLILPYGDKMLLVGLVLALVALGIAYLIQLNVVAAKGFALRTTERNVATLREQQKKLQVELAQKESLAGLTEGIESLGLVPVQHVEYLNANDEVAVR